MKEIDGSDVTDNVASQFPPVETWGTKFCVVPMPNDVTGAYVKVVAAEDDTTVTCDDGRTFNISSAGGYITIEVDAATYMWINSDKQVSQSYHLLNCVNLTEKLRF